MISPCANGCQRGHGNACHAIRSGHLRYCELIAASVDGYADLVDQRTAEPEAVLSPEQQAKQHAAETCPHRVRDAECGCVGKRCGPTGKRPGELVNIGICLACVESSGVGN